MGTLQTKQGVSSDDLYNGMANVKIKDIYQDVHSVGFRRDNEWINLNQLDKLAELGVLINESSDLDQNNKAYYIYAGDLTPSQFIKFFTYSGRMYFTERNTHNSESSRIDEKQL